MSRRFPPCRFEDGAALRNGLQGMLVVMLNNEDERFPPCRFADGTALREQFRSHTVIPTVWWRASGGGADGVFDR